MTGTIIRFDNKRNFGFIRPELGIPGEPKDVYFHGSAMLTARNVFVTTPQVGATVSFTLTTRDERGPQAVNIRVIPIDPRSLLADEEPLPKPAIVQTRKAG